MDAVAPNSARPAQTRAPQSGAAQITADFNTFLRMLTTQLQNQDPLDPVDATDYATQLATFSGVEQQVRTNSLLADLAQRFDLLGMAQLAGWVGQEALTTAPVKFEGSPITLRLEPASQADSAVLVVRDAAGTLVSRESVPASSGTYLWLGADAAGSPLRSGQYSLALESQRRGETIATSPVASYATIEEARRGDSGVILKLRGGAEVGASDIRALRIP